jgi:hypothetical protein
MYMYTHAYNTNTQTYSYTFIPAQVNKKVKHNTLEYKSVEKTTYKDEYFGMYVYVYT